VLAGAPGILYVVIEPARVLGEVPVWSVPAPEVHGG
jgi:hypothetical protein